LEEQERASLDTGQAGEEQDRKKSRSKSKRREEQAGTIDKAHLRRA